MSFQRILRRVFAKQSDEDFRICPRISRISRIHEESIRLNSAISGLKNALSTKSKKKHGAGTRPIRLIRIIR